MGFDRVQNIFGWFIDYCIVELYIVLLQTDNYMEFDRNVKNVLLEVGLSSLQSDFYLIVLKNGPTTVSKVAKTLGINRTNSYVIVDKLKDFNLVWEENKPQGKVLHARPYSSILDSIEEKEKRIENFKGTIKALAPVFDSFTSTQNVTGPKVKLFQSKSGLSTLVDEILDVANYSKEIMLYTNQETEKSFFSKKTHEEFIKRRVENGIRIKVLCIDNDEGKILKALDEKFLRETKLLSPDFNFNAEIYIYENRVCMIDIKEEIIGILIESEELYKIHRHLFEVMWNILK